MRLVGQLSNPSSRLQVVLDVPGGSHSLSPRPSVLEPVTRGLRSGAIQRAVGIVLTATGQPMRVAEVQAAVEELLNQTVSKDSVNWCLSTGARGAEPRFERVARGCYRLLRPL
jgi:hypothetical protein